jgi:hypothetical protein
MRPAGRKRTRVFVNITATCERRSPETDRFNGASTLMARPPGTRLGGRVWSEVEPVERKPRTLLATQQG